MVFPDERLPFVDHREPMGLRLWRSSLALSLAAAIAYPFVPGGEVWKGNLFFDLFGVASIAAIVYGIVRNRPRDRLPWLLVALGQALFVVGDLIFSLYEVVLHESPFPSAADGIYLAAYPVLTGGLALLVRRRRPGQDWPALLDAAIVTVGLGSLSWAVLMAPYTRDRSLTLPELAITLAYPLADVLLLAVAARLLFGGGRRSPSLLLVGVSLASLLITDAVYGLLSLHGTYRSGDSVDIGWMVSYACFALAALHPSMGEVSARFEEVRRRFPVWRLALLTVALATAPTALALDGARPLDRGIFVAAAIALIVLAVLRLGREIRARERAIGRESVLRQAASALVRAIDANGVALTAVEASVALVDAPGAVAIVALGSPEQLTVVAASGTETQLRGRRLSLPAEAESGLAHGGLVEVPRSLLADGVRGVTSKLYPLIIGGRVEGVLAIEVRARPAPDEAHALEALAAQAMLALESRRLAEENFRRRGEQRFRSLVRNSADLIMVVDPELTIRYVAPSVESVLGFPESACLGRTLSEFGESRDAPTLRALVADATGPSGIARRELRLRRHDGSYSRFDVTANNLLADPEVAGIAITASDVGARRSLEDQLRRKAFEDGLTGLPNGELFREQLKSVLGRRASSGVSAAVLYVDMDDFADINDSLGHAAGDALLVEAARRIRTTLRATDMGARLGGDEFAILLHGVRGGSEARVSAERINAALAEPFVIAEHTILCSASIGVAFARAGERDQDRLIQHAVVAMRRAKRDGKARTAVFAPAMEERSVDRLTRVGELRRALDRGEIVVYYQPIVELETGTIVGVEALSRWQHPERGLLPPDEFIPLAEETGLVVPLGRFVLAEACRQAHAWHREQAGGPKLWVSVNISVRELHQPSLLGDVRGALSRSGLDPAALVLELTETAVSSDLEEMIETLERLKVLGLRLAIDDFGTGYSTLNYLRRLPVDILKVDREFVADIETRSAQGRVTEAVIQLARLFHLDVVAEGIEHEAEAERLRALGCRLGQGYLLAPPLDPRQVTVLLAGQDHDRGRRAA